MIFLPTVQLGRLRSIEIISLGRGVRTAQEQTLEITQGPLYRVHQADQSAEGDSSGQGCARQEPAGLFALVQKHMSSPLGSTECYSRWALRHHLTRYPCFMKKETEAREMNLLYAPFPFPALLISSGRAETASSLPKPLVCLHG